MFICEECLENYNNWGIPRSMGPCEDCGHTRVCADIPSKYLERKVKPTKSLDQE
jgi:hypothetical protein